MRTKAGVGASQAVQDALFISELFEHDTSDFTGSLRCTAPAGEQEFTGVVVEMDANNGIFTTLPVVPLDTDMKSHEQMDSDEWSNGDHGTNPWMEASALFFPVTDLAGGPVVSPWRCLPPAFVYWMLSAKVLKP